MPKRRTIHIEDDFLRALTLTTTPEGGTGWTVKDTSSGGTPTYLTGTTGLVLTCAADSEAEILTLYQNNKLVLPIDQLEFVEWEVAVSGIDSVTTLVFGLASNQHDTPDSVTANAWFRMEGSASTTLVVCETDDDVRNVDDVATNLTLGATVKRFNIDFTAGKADVKFSMDDGSGLLKPVARSQTFNMSGYSSGLQPFVQLQKASGTGVPAVTIRRFEAQLRSAA